MASYDPPLFAVMSNASIETTFCPDSRPDRNPAHASPDPLPLAENATEPGVVVVPRTLSPNANENSSPRTLASAAACRGKSIRASSAGSAERSTASAGSAAALSTLSAPRRLSASARDARSVRDARIAATCRPISYSNQEAMPYIRSTPSAYAETINAFFR